MNSCSARLALWRSPWSSLTLTATVRVADFFLGSHTCNFNSLTTHVNEQLVCLLPVGILNAVMFPPKEKIIRYIVFVIYSMLIIIYIYNPHDNMIESSEKHVAVC